MAQLSEDLKKMREREAQLTGENMRSQLTAGNNQPSKNDLESGDVI